MGVEVPIYQGGPDLFSRGPNLKDENFCGPQKKLCNFFFAFFLILKPKTGHFKVFSSQNDANKQGSASLQFVICTGLYRGRKKSLEGRMRPAGRSLAMFDIEYSN